MSIIAATKARPRRTAGAALGLLLAAGGSLSRAEAAEAAVPRIIQGVWAAHGRCDLRAERLTITAHRAGWGKGPFSRVYYDPPTGAVYWAREYVVDNFEPGRNANLLIHNTQGSHMPGAVGMARCGPKLVHASWPPRSR